MIGVNVVNVSELGISFFRSFADKFLEKLFQDINFKMLLISSDNRDLQLQISKAHVYSAITCNSIIP